MVSAASNNATRLRKASPLMGEVGGGGVSTRTGVSESTPTQPSPIKGEGLEQSIWQVLEGVADPEIPVLSVVDLGIVREVTP